jgi:hypothetical protein
MNAGTLKFGSYKVIKLSIWLYSPLLVLGRFFSFLIYLHRLQNSLDGGSARRKAATEHWTTQTQNKRTQISILQVGFELTIPVFQREKTVHASDRVATVIDKVIKLGGFKKKNIHNAFHENP